MTTDTPEATEATTLAPLPDRSVVPAVWGRITNLTVDRGEGSWLVTTDGEEWRRLRRIAQRHGDARDPA